MNQIILSNLFAPIFLSIAILFTKKNTVSKFFYLIVIAIALFVNLKFLLFSNISSTNYVFGNWNRKLGIEFLYDKKASLMLIVLYTIALVHFILYFNSKYLIKNIISFMSLYISGVSGLLLTNDIFNFYVFTEITAIASYALYTINKKPSAIKATFDYLLINFICSSFILLGIFFIYKASGNLNFSEIAKYINSYYNYSTILIGYFLIFISILLKIGLYPMSSTIISIYHHSSIFSVSLLSSINSKFFLFLIAKITAIFYMNNFEQSSFQTLIFLFQALGIFSLLFNAINLFYAKKMKTILSFVLNFQAAMNLISIPYLFKIEFFLEQFTLIIAINALSNLILFKISNHFDKCHKNDLSIFDFSNILKNNTILQIILTLIFLIIGNLPISINFIFKTNILMELFKSNVFFFALTMLSNIIFLSFIINCFANFFDRNVENEKIENENVDSENLYPLPLRVYVLSILLIIMSMLTFFIKF